MAMPSSGTILFSQIQTEFGGANPIALGEYYRGGAYVPNTSFTATIPTSGTIRVGQFFGTQASAPSSAEWNGGSVDTYRVSAGSCTSRVVFNADGTLSSGNSGTGVTFNQNIQGDRWFIPAVAGIGSSYWIRASSVVGSFTSGAAVGTWVSLASGAVWSCQAGGSLGQTQTSSANITFQIASDAAGSHIVATGTVSLLAEKDA